MLNVMHLLYFVQRLLSLDLEAENCMFLPRENNNNVSTMNQLDFDGLYNEANLLEMRTVS